ncbi:MAG TPA: SDR family oxidoreductase [Candidatus Saccharimonadia bacterium]
MKDLKDKVVVITGATSGIGRATALEFCKEGARVVLSGRDVEALKETEQECAANGGRTLSVVCDVSKEDQVEKLAARAAEAFGRIDIWINNAGVNLFAKFEDTPSADFRQVFETDFFGYANGARAALKRFKTQGSGTLINVDSIEGITPKPYSTAYTSAKHAVRALASALRMELALDGAKGIEVCTVLPPSVDTPMFAHSANYTGHALKASPTSMPATEVAQAIVRLAKRPQRELVLGMAPKGSIMQYLFAPKAYEQTESRGFPARHLTEDEAAPAAGNLFNPTSPHTTSGGWNSNQTKNQFKLRPWMLIGGAIVGAGALASWALIAGSKKAAQEPKQQQITNLKKLVPVFAKG